MNKYQDALDRLKHINLDLILEKLGHEVADEVSDYGMCDYPNLEMSYDIEAIQELVKRATPKKPINKTKNSNIHYENCDIVICPHCGKRLKLKSKGKHCDKCGGALDWSDEE